jgi:hypothetical protein
MSMISQSPRQIIAGHDIRSQRAWARIAGLMYWMVLLVDLTGLQLHALVGRWLMLSGSLLTVPLAFGLYYAVRPAGEVLARGALGFRLLEAGLGLVSTAAGFGALRSEFVGSSFGTAVLQFAHWNDATALGAFVFTIGSTIFFYLFVKSGYIPQALAWLGLLASVIAMAACLMHFARSSFPAMTMYAWIPMLLAETSTGTWLLVKSVKQPNTRPR